MKSLFIVGINGPFSGDVRDIHSENLRSLITNMPPEFWARTIEKLGFR